MIVIVLLLFFMVPWAGLQCMIDVFVLRIPHSPLQIRVIKSYGITD